MLGSGEHEEKRLKVFQEPERHFDVKNLGLVREILGIQIERVETVLHQKKYAKRLAALFKDVGSFKVPLSSKLSLVDDSLALPDNFQSLFRTVMVLVSCIRRVLLGSSTQGQTTHI